MSAGTGKFHRRIAALTVLACVVVAAAVVASVVAPAATAMSCPPPPKTVYPFLPWGDGNGYVLATGGTFEAGQPSWTLQGGAKIVSGNEPFYADSITDKQSLYLPAGSSAISPCTTAPNIVAYVRFFVKNSGVSGGQLKVEVLVNGVTYQAGTIKASAWWPTAKLQAAAPTTYGPTPYQVRLTPIGTGSAFTVDDVYLDPLKSQ